ncbi:hypothetical protein TUMEXPCC7403_19660 [Tumidithrix helvetica PCC 7403]|uniref:hypothetical protein n=1 Tax=Tumidithrix helvetica TaxID=3457545 RepID=UPI003C925787
MNIWQLIPKTGISLGEIQITFNDSWQDVCQKLNLKQAHGVLKEHHINGWFLDNILETGASIRFQFEQNSLSEILFCNGSLFFEDINFIGSEIEDVIQQLTNRGIKIFYDYVEFNYISPELQIYFCTGEAVGGEGTDVQYVGIVNDECELTPEIKQVTSPVV